MTINRRKFLSSSLGGAAAAASTLTLPTIAKAQSSKTFKFKMTCAYPGGAPFYSTGPGSATDFIKRVVAMSGGRIKIKFYAAGELIPALGGSVFHRRTIWYGCFSRKCLVESGRWSGALGRSLRTIRIKSIGSRQHRHANDGLVSQTH